MTSRASGTPASVRTPRVVAARKLLRRAGRDRAGRFLVEGAQAVREALDGDVTVHEVFVTATAADRNPDLLDRAAARGVRIGPVTDEAAAALSETVTPQGLVAVCDLVDVPLADVVDGATFVAVCAGISDPGNVGTVVRVADAAGCGGVVLAGDTVDPHNGKAVRASTGSLFHLPVTRDRDVPGVLDACRDAGLATLVADGRGETGLYDGGLADVLAGPVAWVFGSEAHGAGREVLDAADHRVRVPVLGRAESLNLATAAAVCLYATVAARTPVTCG
ncbi:TrmH family RNA methyltransferase [Pseudonocardia endophytica]|uniref:TrmH family RNA methyltransferase n=1 Tax=Pseudonocardia endophytica TaxID=401976 RepID=UPI001A9D0226|nr:RNA methyltransferase [Pseudonocardia endophytica]